jgi:hypothetical protein
VNLQPGDVDAAIKDMHRAGIHAIVSTDLEVAAAR